MTSSQHMICVVRTGHNEFATKAGSYRDQRGFDALSVPSGEPGSPFTIRSGKASTFEKELLSIRTEKHRPILAQDLRTKDVHAANPSDIRAFWAANPAFRVERTGDGENA
jgi:hypothetical protein